MNQSNDPNNPWNQSPAAPPASGNPRDYTTASLQHKVGRPYTNEDLERRNQPPEETEEEIEPKEKEAIVIPFGTMRREFGMATGVPSQGLVPPELQGAITYGATRGQRLTYMPENREETEEEKLVSSIKADPREEVTVYPGQVDAPNQPSPEGVVEPSTEEVTETGQTEQPAQQPTVTQGNVETEEEVENTEGE